MPDKLPALRALRFLQQEQWAILPATLHLMHDIVMRANAPDFEAVLAKRGQRLEEGSRTLLRGSTAVIPVTGPIFPRANLFTEMSGASSIQMLALDLEGALANPRVHSIVLNIDSPGGMLSGVSEFAAMVRGARKPVIAYVGNLAASAGYWIAAAASKIWINNTAQLGSIGVVSSVWIDEDEDLVEIVSSQSPGKRTDVRTDEGRAQIQRDTDELADVFIDTVADYRKVTREKVISDFGRGGVLIGRTAIKAGMADRLGSLESLIAELAGPASSR